VAARHDFVEHVRHFGQPIQAEVTMNLHEIGTLVRERRDTLGLSQDRLAKLAGLSRATINQLETGALMDLGVIKLACLLELVGLTFEAHARTTPHRGLLMASRTASVS
jgi:DNA-binding XRE family transcriptional regulator